MTTGIERLSKYRQHQARIRVLSTYSVGCGITLSRISETDQLQQLHERLRPLRSHMYLTKREQKIETAAHANLGSYPAGTKAQRDAIPKEGRTPEETRLLNELRGNVEGIIKARGGERDDIDEVIARITELQDLQAEVARLDQILTELETYRPNDARLLRVRYVEGKEPDAAASDLGITRPTFTRWQRRAAAEFERLAM